MTLAPVVLLVGALVSLVIATAVRYSGAARILNMIDYTREDPAALNAAVGSRLFALPVVFLVLAYIAWQIPSASIFAVSASVPSVLVAAFWAAAVRVRSS